MSWSLGEVQALSIKACRGAGYTWGLAEEAGYAIRWLAAHGLPGPAALSGLLRAIDGDESDAELQCPIVCGTTLSDAHMEDFSQEIALGWVRFPLLLVPFIVGLPRGSGLAITWGDGTGIAIENDLVTCVGSTENLLANAADCTLRRSELAQAETVRKASRVPAEAADDLKSLAGFAARTYAPATEASRMSGAGAGTTDND